MNQQANKMHSMLDSDKGCGVTQNRLVRNALNFK